MNLAAVDLNLLVAFEALMAERSVTRAGQRIGLGQPAMSAALSRLRLVFQDELLVRVPGAAMRPFPGISADVVDDAVKETIGEKPLRDRHAICPPACRRTSPRPRELFISGDSTATPA